MYVLNIDVTSGGGGPAPSIEMLTKTKMWQKMPVVSSVSVSYNIFRAQQMNNNIDDQGARAPSIQFLQTNLYA